MTARGENSATARYGMGGTSTNMVVTPWRTRSAAKCPGTVGGRQNSSFANILRNPSAFGTVCALTDANVYMASPDPLTPRRLQVDLVTATRPDPVPRASDPAVTAAFLAFHRAHTAPLGSRSSGRGLLSSSAWAFVGLAVVGFAGGLFLASVSFNHSEPTSIAGARPAEMIYLPPATAAEQPAISSTAALSSTAAIEDAVVVVDVASNEASVRRAKVEQSDEPIEDPAAGSEAAWNAVLVSEAGVPDPTANFAAATRLAAAGYSLTPGDGDSIQSGSAGVEVPSIPEPAAAPILCAGLALLVGIKHLNNKRRT